MTAATSFTPAKRLSGLSPVELADSDAFHREYWERNPAVAAAKAEAARQRDILARLGCFDDLRGVNLGFATVEVCDGRAAA